ncbi:MAG: hypothetical protein K2Z80_06890 [Xanthobacteraceae bacterium]|nr:hypothetical protein [Xanthobacteraceae bacterium]
MPRQRHGHWLRNLLGVVALAAANVSLAADLPLKPEPPAAPAATGPMTPPTATCREWSDGCRTCRRAPDGAVSCSNVGIACVPKEATCTADAPTR